MSLINANNLLTILSKRYAQQYGSKATADQLMDFAQMQDTAGHVNLCSVLDQLADNDNVTNNHISNERFLTNGNNMYFQSKDGQITDFNVANNTASVLSKDDFVKMLNDGNPWGTDVSFGADKFTEIKNTFGDDTNPVDLGDHTVQNQKMDLAAINGQNKVKSVVNDYLADGNNLTDFSKIFGQEKNTAFATSKNGNPKMLVVQDGNAYVATYDKAKGTDIQKIDPKSLLTPDQLANGDSVVNMRVENGKLTYDIVDKANKTVSNGVTSTNWGDPHFKMTVNGKDVQCFDLQGKNNTAYNMLDNDAMSLNSKFSNTADENSRVLTDQDLQLKGSGINIVSHANGKFEIYKDGQQIGDQNNYGDPRIADSGIQINFSNSKLKIDYQGRELTQDLMGSEIDNHIDTKTGDTGILTQLIGSIDNDGNREDGKTTVNGQTLKYDVNNQVMVNDQASAISAPVITHKSDNANTLATSFLNSSNNNATWASKVFDGAFKDAGNITNPYDSRLNILAGDSSTVIAAKNALKETLLYDLNKADQIEKAKAQQALTNWITLGSSSIMSDLNSGTGSVANRFKENDGYSRSQWNEFMGNGFVTQDNFLNTTSSPSDSLFNLTDFINKINQENKIISGNVYSF